jgi:hypothetical protein
MHMPVLASSTGLMVAESVVNPPAHALVSASTHALVQLYAVADGGRGRCEPTCSCFPTCRATLVSASPHALVQVYAVR